MFFIYEHSFLELVSSVMKEYYFKKRTVMNSSEHPSQKNNMACPKVVVAHPAQQHSYHLGRALTKNSSLFAYVTTIYYRRNKILYRILGLLIGKGNKERMLNRRNSYIEPLTKQFDEILGLAFLFFGRVLRNKELLGRIGSWLGSRFGIKVAKLAVDNDIDILICFDSYALSAFEGVASSSIVKVLDMSSIPIPKICQIIDNQPKLGGHSELSKAMTRSIFSSELITQAEREIGLADYFLVASTFTQRQLIDMGVESQRVCVVPYGIDLERYKPRSEANIETQRPVTLLFVGRMTMVKGFHVLIEALTKLKPESFRCLLVGHPQNSESQLSELPSCFEFLGPLASTDMPALYTRANILIAPSLYDGFGFTILEAMASGLCVVCSRSTGASDLITHGKSGMLIEAGDADDLFQKLEQLISDPRQLSSMKILAREAVKNYSWDTYDGRISRVIEYIHEENS